MSAEATGWVFRHSPYSGATFAVHLAIADSVNDQHGNEFWMMQANLATKARTTRETANRSVSTLIEDGFIEALTDLAVARATSSARRFRFLWPNVPVAYESRTLVTTDHKGAQSDHMPCDERSHVTQGEPKQEPNTRALTLVDQIEERRDDLMVQRVFAAWQDSVEKPRARLDNKRRKLIERRLREYGPEYLTLAVTGWKFIPHNRGENDRHQPYNDLGLLLRDAEHIERFHDAAEAAERPPPRGKHDYASSFGDEAWWAAHNAKGES